MTAEDLREGCDGCRQCQLGYHCGPCNQRWWHRHDKKPRELRVDKRGRVDLSQVVATWARRYLTEEHPDGTLVLHPAELVKASEVSRETKHK